MLRFLIVTLTILLTLSTAEAGFKGFLRANTVANIRMGPFLDSIDGVELEHSLLITQSDVRISKKGGPLNAKYRSTAAVYDSSGYYWFALGSVDTNTVGRLMIVVNESGAILVEQTYQVLDETIYDTYFKDIP